MIGPIVADIQGTELSTEDIELLRHPLIGGVILFAHNYVDPAQLNALVKSIKAIPKTSPLLVSVDHEGGRVQRFRSGFTHIPAMGLLGKSYDDDPALTLRHAFLIGWLLAAELRIHNIDYSYTPVLDLDYQISKVIGNRAFHRQPEIVVAISKALIDGIHAVGMAVNGKHFPGHGAVSIDSHVAIPVDERDLETLWQSDIIPYQKLINDRYLDSIMTAHVIYPKVDADPPCFSSFWLQRILRDELNFDGVIFSDDLVMEGASVAGNYAERAEAALRAGCDMLLVCNKREAVIQVLDHIESFYVPDARMNQRCQVLYASPLAADFKQHPNWQAAITVVNQLNELANYQQI
ncbi:MAG: beta-N-acetylhexosaminidase [Gammaproteobacteria bacterium]